MRRCAASTRRSQRRCRHPCRIRPAPCRRSAAGRQSTRHSRRRSGRGRSASPSKPSWTRSRRQKKCGIATSCDGRATSRSGSSGGSRGAGRR
eukprot:5233261-Prymnesium_polylepis.1